MSAETSELVGRDAARARFVGGSRPGSAAPELNLAQLAEGVGNC